MESSGDLDFRNVPKRWRFERFGSSDLKLMAEATQHRGGLHIHCSEPRLVIVQVNEPAVWAPERSGAVTVVGKEIIDIVIRHLIDLAEKFGTEVIPQQVVDELAALLGFNPELAEFIEVLRFAEHALD